LTGVPGASGLEGRTAIVTGAGQGVGRGIALALAARGASVVVAARRAETGEPVVREILDRGQRGLCVETDVTSRESVEGAVAAAVRAFGSLEVVVHNAFRGGWAHRLEDLDDRVWRSCSRTAVWGSYHCARAAYPHLLAAGRRGRLVLLTSNAGVEGSAAMPAYAAVKGAQRALAKSLAREWGAHGITVNCVAPLAGTPALEEAFVRMPELEGRLLARSALARMGDPEADVGPVVAFLAGDEGGYVTGQTLVCDGGSFTGL
jgi:3-oxoacyl-[acyl-carrier protein] reductase